MENNDILQFLEEDFLRNVPYSRDNIVVDENVGATGFAPLSSWHDAVREHREMKPSIPAEPLAVNMSKEVIRSNNVSKAISPLKRNSSVSSIDSDRNMIAVKSKELRAQRYKKFLENDEKYNLSNLCRQGWTLSKGWRNRPDVQQWDMEVVEKDIDFFNIRRNRRLSRAQLDIPHGIACPISNKGLAVDGPAILQAVKREIISPGPRYSDRLPTPPAASKAIVNPRDASYSTTHQRFDSVQKDIHFGSSSRFPENSTTHELSPGPVYLPKLTYVKPNTSSTPKLYGNGREYFGSIYYEIYNTSTPGPKYNTLESSKKLSYYATAPGVKFGGNNKKPAED